MTNMKGGRARLQGTAAMALSRAGQRAMTRGIRQALVENDRGWGVEGARFEAEADRAAAIVDQGGARAAQGSGLAASLGRASPVGGSCPSSAASELAAEAVAGSGHPLDRATRLHLESGFGHDFSRVRVHTDTAAAHGASELGALAFTRGEQIAFGVGQYAPATFDGRKLLAHELAHVVQQTRHGVRIIQRQADPDQETSGGDSIWNEAFRLADESRWEEVAALVNGFSAENLRYFLQTFKGQPDKIAWLHLGAVGNATVGATSALARATRTTYLDFSFNEQVTRADWSRAAYFLNGFSAEDIRKRLGHFSTDRLQALRDGAVSNAELGVDSAAAKLIAEVLAQRSERGDTRALMLPKVRGADADALVRVMRVVDGIRPSLNRPGAYTMVVDGQPQTLTAQQAQEIKARFASTLSDRLHRIESKASNAVSRYNSQNEIDKKHWAAPVVKTIGTIKTLGKFKDPGPQLIECARRAADLANRARAAAGTHHFVAAASLMADAESEAIAASKMWQAYFEGIISAGETSVTILEITRDASFALLAILATIATAGAAAGALSAVEGTAAAGAAAEGTTAFGVSLGVSSTTAANVIAAGAPVVAGVGEAVVKMSMGEQVDWGAVVIDTAVQILIARFGGKLTGKLAKLLMANPETRQLGARVTEKIVHTVILHVGSTVLMTAVQDAYQAAKGKRITWEAFVEQIIAQLTDPKSLAVLALTGFLSSAAERKFGGPSRVPRTPSPAAPSVEPPALARMAAADSPTTSITRPGSPEPVVPTEPAAVSRPVADSEPVVNAASTVSGEPVPAKAAAAASEPVARVKPAAVSESATPPANRARRRRASRPASPTASEAMTKTLSSEPASLKEPAPETAARPAVEPEPSSKASADVETPATARSSASNDPLTQRIGQMPEETLGNIMEKVLAESEELFYSIRYKNNRAAATKIAETIETARTTGKARADMPVADRVEMHRRIAEDKRGMSAKRTDISTERKVGSGTEEMPKRSVDTVTTYLDNPEKPQQIRPALVKGAGSYGTMQRDMNRPNKRGQPMGMATYLRPTKTAGDRLRVGAATAEVRVVEASRVRGGLTSMTLERGLTDLAGENFNVMRDLHAPQGTVDLPLVGQEGAPTPGGRSFVERIRGTGDLNAMAGEKTAAVAQHDAGVRDKSGFSQAAATQNRARRFRSQAELFKALNRVDQSALLSGSQVGAALEPVRASFRAYMKAWVDAHAPRGPASPHVDPRAVLDARKDLVLALAEYLQNQHPSDEGMAP